MEAFRVSSASNSGAPMAESQVSWSDLPYQLLPLIGKRLETFIDVLRFRSVCRLWRDSLPNVQVIFPLSRLHNPNPKFLSEMYESAVLLRRTIYRFSPIDHRQSLNSVSYSSKGFLAMIDSADFDSRFHWLNLLFNRCIKEGMKVNFLDFRIEEVAQSYSLFIRSHIAYFKTMVKFLVFPNSEKLMKKYKNSCIIVAIQFDKCLWFMEHGEGIGRLEWKRIGKRSCYDDAIVYKGQIYTVDRHGGVFLIDSSMELVLISPPIPVWSDLKQLVECGGELYLVSRFIERDESYSFDFKVYRMDQRRGRWAKVKNLGNHAFVLGVNSFSVYAPDLEGFERNCVYFLHEVNSCLSEDRDVYVFNLEKNTIMKSSVKILKAPLVWLDWKVAKLAN